jgi:hypothetical protein
LFPLNTVLFPGAALNLHVFEPRYKQMISECLEGGEAFGVCLIRDGDEAGDPDVMPYEIGTTAEIGDVTPLENGRYYISTTGRRRFRVERVVAREPFLTVDVAYLAEDPPEDGVTIDRTRARDTRGVPRLSATARRVLRHARRHRGAGGSGRCVVLDRRCVASRRLDEAAFARALEHRAALDGGTRASCGACCRSCARCSNAKRESPQQPAAAAPGGTFRATQEKFFGKHFSLN